MKLELKLFVFHRDLSFSFSRHRIDNEKDYEEGL